MNVKKKKMLLIICVLIFTTILVWNISQCKKNSARYDHKCIMVFTHSTSYSCHILMKLDRFSNNNQIPNFIKIHPVGVELFHVDRRAEWEADTTKLKKSLFSILRTCLKKVCFNFTVNSYSKYVISRVGLWLDAITV
jgi:hypothetical protein